MPLSKLPNPQMIRAPVQDIVLTSQRLHVPVFFVCTNVCVCTKQCKNIITPSLGTNEVFLTVLHAGNMEGVQVRVKV